MSRARLAYKVLKVQLPHPYYRVPEILEAMSENFYLESTVYQSARWTPPNYIQHAVCGHRMHPGSRDDAPPPKVVGECECGIYAYNTIDLAIDTAIRAFGFRLCVAVAMTGRIRAYENALRAQKCQVMAVIVPGRGIDPVNTFGRLFNNYDHARLLDIIENNGLPVMSYGKHWHNPAWVREWADDRNLIPQADMVEADRLLEKLEIREEEG